METIPSPGQKVLLLWASYIKKEHLTEVVKNLQEAVKDEKLVAVENFDKLTVSDHATSSFDIVYCGTLTPTLTFHPAELFAEVARILKPGGTIIIRESVSAHDNVPTLRTASKLASALKLSGFINVSQPETLPVSKGNVEEYEKHFQHHEGDVSLIEIRAYKPCFEVGSTMPLFASIKTSSKVDSNVAEICMPLADVLDENVELIDEDDFKPDPTTLRASSKLDSNVANICMPFADVLDENVELTDEDDLKKRDPSTLRVGATTLKRKACYNCTCGLAEILAKQAAKKLEENKSATSSCGNCYLGDAYRCARCLYFAMPAFKPGKKMILSDSQLKVDV